MKDSVLFDTINPTFIDLTMTAIHQSLLAWNTGVFYVPPKFGLGGGAQYECDTRNLNLMVNNACKDGFHCLDVDFVSSSPEVWAKKIDNNLQHYSLEDLLTWYGPRDGTTSQWSWQLWWGLPWLCPGGADRAAWQCLQSSQQLCCDYWSLNATLSCSADGQVCHCQQQLGCPLQRPQQQWHHQHHQCWEYGISQWKYDCRGCDVAWRLGMVAVMGFRITFACYFILGFVNIS